MPLLERVATLLRANLNDLLHRAENPGVLLQQLIADLQNQAIQVKTQIAVLMTDLHLLEQKAKEANAAVEDWQQRAMLAVQEGEEALARVALERRLTQEESLRMATEQQEEQRLDIQAMTGRYKQLLAKMQEAELGLEQWKLAQRRARGQKVMDGRTEDRINAGMKRLGEETAYTNAQRSTLHALAAQQDADAQLVRMQRDQKIDALLADLQQTKLLPDGS